MVSVLKEGVYYTHWNGGRPLAVEIVPGRVSVCVQDDDEKGYIGPVLNITNYEDVMVAVDGEVHSILVHVKQDEYIYLGEEIIKFRVPGKDVIRQLEGKIGNSDVPYTFGVGDKFIYLFSEMVYFPVENYDPYNLYYGFEPKAKKLKGQVQTRKGWKPKK
jgi:hypothetical protein